MASPEEKMPEKLLQGYGKMHRVYLGKSSVKMTVLRPCAHANVRTSQCMMAMDHVCSSWINVSVRFYIFTAANVCVIVSFCTSAFCFFALLHAT
jgi:hypothetical protein